MKNIGSKDNKKPSFSSSEALKSTTAMIIRSDYAIFYNAQTVHFEVENREPPSFASTLCFTPVQNHALPAPLPPSLDFSADILNQAEASPADPRTSQKIITNVYTFIYL